MTSFFKILSLTHIEDMKIKYFYCDVVMHEDGIYLVFLFAYEKKIIKF